MNNQSENTSLSLPQLVFDDFVLRAITCDYWIDKKTGKIRYLAFRRRPVDSKGLSVFIVATYSIERCINSTEFTCFAVGKLQVGAIRTLGLDVIPDSNTHANIDSSLPFLGQDDDRRNHLANRLAEICERV